MTSPTDQYLRNLPDAERLALQKLRETVASIVPEATEKLSTNVPAFYYKGKYLVSFSAAKDHLALLVMQGDAMKAYADDLKRYDTGSKIIRFTPDNPLPDAVIEKIVRFRQDEIDKK